VAATAADRFCTRNIYAAAASPPSINSGRGAMINVSLEDYQPTLGGRPTGVFE